jgi:hypothetical protein
MRKLLLTGVVLGVVSAGCQSNKTPTGPASVTVTQTTSTTTSIAPPPTTTTSTSTTIIPPVVATARRYFTFVGGPNVPNDMSLLFQLTASSSANSFFGARRGLRLRPEADNLTYSVQGVFTTGSGIGGTVKGVVNGSPTPLDDGQFTGTLTANFPGCTAERQYSGPITSQFLTWSAGRTLADCPAPVSWPPSFTLLRSDAPPAPPPVAATTTIPTNTTTSVPGGSTTQSTRFTATITSNTNTPIPADLSLFFRLLSGGSSPFSLARIIRPLAATYAVTGGYTTPGFSGSITGTLDGTPDNGHFTGVFTADIPNCTGRTNYDGQITRVTLTLNPQGQIDSCGGNNPLAGGVVGAANGAPATTSTPTTSIAPTTTTTVPTTTTTSIVTTTTTTRPTTTTTSIPTTTTSSSTSTSTSTSTSSSTTSTSTTTTSTPLGLSPRRVR